MPITQPQIDALKALNVQESTLLTALVADAHAAGLQVHAWTFRPENQFLPRSLWSGEDPATTNTAGAITEIRACLDAGIDAFFTDSPAIGRQAVDLR